MGSSRILIACIVTYIIAGCSSTSTYYVGTFESNNGKHLLYWEKNKRTWSESVTPIVVLTKCSTNSVFFEDYNKGVHFRKRPTDVGAAFSDSCGFVSAKSIEELHEGSIEITFLCRPKVDAFSIGNRNYPSTGTYIVEVEKYSDTQQPPTLKCDK